MKFYQVKNFTIAVLVVALSVWIVQQMMTLWDLITK